VCIGDKACFKRQTAVAKVPAQTSGDDSDGPAGAEVPPEPRVAWHGPAYLQRFWDRELAERLHGYTAFSEPVLRAVLLVLLNRDYDMSPWFAVRHPSVAFDNMETYDGRPMLDPEKTRRLISTMEGPDLGEEIRAAAGKILLATNSTSDRSFLAQHYGAVLDEHFVVEEEYLQKKTKAELVALGEELGVFGRPEARAYRLEVLNQKIGGRWDQLKKSELVDVFLKSGVDLTGRVPAEIRRAAENPAD